MIAQALQAPLTHRHREITIPSAHNIHQLRRGHNVRLDLVARLRPLLVRIGIPDEAGFAPGWAEEAESEPIECRCQSWKALCGQLLRCTYGMLGPTSTSDPLLFRITLSLAG